MRRNPDPPIAGGPGPADFPLGSVESRAAARRRLEPRNRLETVVYLDDDGEPIYEPGVTYSQFVIEAPRPMTREEWLARCCSEMPADPIEREREIAARQTKLSEQQERWLKRQRESERRLQQHLEGKS